MCKPLPLYFLIKFQLRLSLLENCSLFCIGHEARAGLRHRRRRRGWRAGKWPNKPRPHPSSACFLSICTTPSLTSLLSSINLGQVGYSSRIKPAKQEADAAADASSSSRGGFSQGRLTSLYFTLSCPCSSDVWCFNISCFLQLLFCFRSKKSKAQQKRYWRRLF